MTLTKEQIDNITNEFNQWKDRMYANKSLAERQDLGQFFTPPSLTIRMIEKFQDLEGPILDPCCGAGNLLAATIMAGADPKRCYGIEIDEKQAEICRNRLEKYGVPRENIITGDCLDDATWDIIKKRIK